jgi:hypothetical protein
MDLNRVRRAPAIREAPKFILLCILTVGANSLLSVLCGSILKLPLFLDTVFTAALAFTAGPFWGIAAAVLTTIAGAFRINNSIISVFVLCSIAEVLLICLVRKKVSTVLVPGQKNREFFGAGAEPFSLISAFAILLLLYIGDFLAISVLGGILDFVLYELLPGAKPYFSPEDTFKMGLPGDTMPVLAMDIISRIPINIVDRFIVIFGGFFISRVMKKAASL